MDIQPGGAMSPEAPTPPAPASEVAPPGRRFGRLMAAGLFVVAVGALLLVGVLSVGNSRLAIRWLAGKLLQEVGERTVAEMRVLLGQARPPIDFLGARLKSDPTLAAGSRLAPHDAAWDGRARLLLTAMAAHPDLWQMSFGDVLGNFTIVTNLGAGAYRIEQSRVQDGVTWNRVWKLPGTSTPPEWTKAPAYDPRLRPWYRDALARGGFTWTEPYFFKHGGQIGISAVAPVVSVSGGTLGVVGADVRFRDISRFLRQMPPARPGLVFVTSTDGALLAAPELDRPVEAMPMARDNADPRIRAAVAELEAMSWESTEAYPLDVRAGNSRWLGVALPLEPKARAHWRVVSLVPWDDVMLPIETRNRMTWAICLVGLLVCLGLGLRLRRLALEARRARELGSYHLEEILGSGGMGEVWRGRHRLLARPAAIKLIHPRAMKTACPEDATVTLRRFVREARATAALNSPHTISVYDFGLSDNDTFFYVMELLEGLDFDRLVTRFGPVSPARTVRLLRQACLSLQEAHAAGLVHRDVKPSNLFACRAGHEVDFVKVLDFGLVKQYEAADPSAGRLTSSDAVFGTPEFMAPEQALSRPVDGRADVYALGCVAFWLLTGRCVFLGETPMQIVLKHTREAPEPPSRYAPAVPPALDAIVLACLEKDPEQRPDAVRLGTLLEACAGSITGDELRRWWDEHLPRQARGPVS